VRGTFKGSFGLDSVFRVIGNDIPNSGSDDSFDDILEE